MKTHSDVFPVEWMKKLFDAGFQNVFKFNNPLLLYVIGDDGYELALSDSVNKGDIAYIMALTTGEALGLLPDSLSFEGGLYRLRIKENIVYYVDDEGNGLTGLFSMKSMPDLKENIMEMLMDYIGYQLHKQGTYMVRKIEDDIENLQSDIRYYENYETMTSYRYNEDEQDHVRLQLKAMEMLKDILLQRRSYYAKKGGCNEGRK